MQRVESPIWQPKSSTCGDSLGPVAGDWRLRIGSADDLDVVEPLWVAVHHRHSQTMPELAPDVTDAQTRNVRRALYEELLAKPDSLPLLALIDEHTVGYGLAHVLPVENTWIPDTRATGSRIGEIESLSVLPRYRGGGLGAHLLDRLEKHLNDLGVEDLILGALPGNHDAIRLYERRGYQPTWLYLSRFHGQG
jgi:ribosomal protein S18 acetylase RimI-like enzyme